MTENTLARSSEEKEEVKEILDKVEKLPEPQKQQVTRSLELYQGDLPHPDILKGYNELYPEAAKKIIDNGIAESVHRREMDKRFLSAQIFAHNLGQFLGFIVALVIILSGAYLILKGHTITGTILSGISAVGVIGLFTNQNRSDKKDKD